MQPPLVSIAMCTYNGELYLREQLDSLVEQDYPNLEIIILDDRSTDSTFQILEEYAAKYSKITAIQNETNLGYLKNFEAAIQRCSGEYIALCDQDDIWFPNKISTLAKEIGDHLLIYTRLKLIDHKGVPMNRNFPELHLLEGSVNLAFLFMNCVTGHTVLFKKELVQDALPFPENIEYHDHWLAFVATTAGTIKFYPEPLSLYRYHENNISMEFPEKKKKPDLSPKEERRALQRKAAESRIRHLDAFLSCGKLSEQDRALIHTIRSELSRSMNRRGRNLKLWLLIRKHGNELFPMFKVKKQLKAVKKELSNGYQLVEGSSHE